MSDTGSAEACIGFDDTEGGHLPHIHYHNPYNYLPMTQDMAEVFIYIYIYISLSLSLFLQPLQLPVHDPRHG